MINLKVPPTTAAMVNHDPVTDIYELLVTDGQDDAELMTSLMKQIVFMHEGVFGTLYHDLEAIDRAATILEQRGMVNCTALLRAIADELREDYHP